MKRILAAAIVLASISGMPSTTDKVVGNVKMVGNIKVKGAVVGGGGGSWLTKDGGHWKTKDGGNWTTH